MGTFSIWHWLIVLVIVILLFGRDRIPQLMGDVAKGIKNFKKGMADDENSAEAKDPKAIDAKVEKTVDHQSSDTSKTC